MQIGELPLLFKESETSLGVFYPNHYIFATFPSFSPASQAAFEIRKAGFADDDVTALDGIDTIRFFKEFHQHQGLLGDLMTGISKVINTEEAFVEEDITRAKQGAGLLVVYAPTQAKADRVKEIAAPLQPIAMRWYLREGVHKLI